jgi:NAD(P)H-quinone oxidoreductase subunit 4
MALLLLILLPLVGCLLLPLLPERLQPLRVPAAGIALAQMLLALLLWPGGPQEFSLAWLPRLGLEFSLGIDGLSLPLVLLSGLVTAMAILASPSDQSRPRLYFGLFLATNLGLVTCLLARNALLFLLALELILIPATLLIAIWGGEQRAGAAIRYLLYNAVSGICILAGILAMAWLNPRGFSFDFSDLAAADLPESSARWVLALLLVGFGLKLPLVPLHGWQPIAYS